MSTDIQDRKLVTRNIELLINIDPFLLPSFTQIHGVLVGNHTPDRSDIGTNGRHRRNLGSRSQEPRTKFHAESVRADNYGHLHARATAGAAVYRILWLQRLLKNVHRAACLTDVRRGWRWMDEKVHRPTGSKGEIKRDAIYRQRYRLNV